MKYVSPDGKREAIYNSSGILVEDPRDIGTYNFCPSKKNDIVKNNCYFICDMLPWMIFGNDDHNPGQLINYIEKHLKG